MTIRYGHVPVERMRLYEIYRRDYRDADRLGGTLSNMGHRALANHMWEAAEVLKARATSLRVVLDDDGKPEPRREPKRWLDGPR